MIKPVPNILFNLSHFPLSQLWQQTVLWTCCVERVPILYDVGDCCNLVTRYIIIILLFLEADVQLEMTGSKRHVCLNFCSSSTDKRSPYPTLIPNLTELLVLFISIYSSNFSNNNRFLIIFGINILDTWTCWTVDI